MNRTLITNIQDSINFIENNIQEKISYSDISSISLMSKSSFYNIFSRLTGTSLKEYVRKRRLSLSAYYLVSGDLSITDIAFKFAYNSYEGYSRAFKAMYGLSPKKFRKNGVYTDVFPKIYINFENLNGGVIMNCTEMNKKLLINKLGESKKGYLLDIDIDAFEKINETLGRDFGDRVLITVPDRIKTTLMALKCDSDVTRISADEFCVVLKNTSREDTIELCSSIMESMKTPIALEDRTSTVSVSIGIVPFNIDQQPCDSLSNVRKAMLSAKENGRNQYFEYSR